MQSVALTLLLCVAAAGAAATADHPISKVITMLKELKEQAITEGQAEEVSYTKFTYWCSTSTAELKDAIAEEKETIDELTDRIAGLTKEIESLGEEIGNLEEQIKELQASAKSAKEDRAEASGLYDKANADLASTITAVEGCIKALQEAEKTTEPSMLMATKRQVKMVLALIGMKATATQRSALAAFASEEPRPDQISAGDLAKHTDKYDFKSENVIELLKNLQLKFEDDKLAGTKAETNALNSYDLSKSARDAAIKAAEKSKAEKTTAKGIAEKNHKEATTDKENTEKDLKADSESLEDTKSACNVKATEWAERSKTRTMEIEAMDQAVKILAKTTGVRTEAPSNPIPPAAPVKDMFLQLRQVSDPKMKAVALLKQAATDAHSKALERLAVEVAAHLSGPFDAVNNMIEKMIFRLMDEQKQEDEHKHWCDLELEKSNTMKDDKDDKIKDLSAEIKVENAEVVKRTSEIEAANKMISEIVAFVKEATEVRQTGKQENNLAVKDAEAAQTAVTNAIAVLTAFYKESGEVPKEPWEFIQAPRELGKKPSTWDASYTGVADPDSQPGGIISILESVSEKFAEMESQTKAQEAEDQKAYEESMKEYAIEKAERQQEVEMKTQEKARRVDKIASLSGTKKNVEAELEKTEQYLEDLKPACVNGDSDYETRKASRSKEIDSLHVAQQTLKDAFNDKDSNAKFLQIKRH